MVHALPSGRTKVLGLVSFCHPDRHFADIISHESVKGLWMACNKCHHGGHTVSVRVLSSLTLLDVYAQVLL